MTATTPPVPTPMYVYRARVARIHDGDTLTLAIDLGCFVGITRTVRLLGLDTPEVVGPDKARGLASTQATRDWCAAAALANPDTTYPLVVATKLDAGDKYGRMLTTVYSRDNPISLNQFLLDENFAVPYDGGKRG